LHFSAETWQTPANVSSCEKSVSVTGLNFKSCAFLSLEINYLSALLFADAMADRFQKVETAFNLIFTLVFRGKKLSQLGNIIDVDSCFRFRVNH
jgi:hypothetical protein